MYTHIDPLELIIHIFYCWNILMYLFTSFTFWHELINSKSNFLIIINRFNRFERSMKFFRVLICPILLLSFFFFVIMQLFSKPLTLSLLTYVIRTLKYILCRKCVNTVSSEKNNLWNFTETQGVDEIRKSIGIFYIYFNMNIR